MAKGFKKGVGGANPLNFKVVGGTIKPDSPSENTIWVNTGTPMTSYVFSATEPENPENGMIWIQIGISSAVAFNALKKNTLKVYPISAKRYNYEWGDKEAQIYQGGEWIDWITYLYKDGDQFTSVTGGWKYAGNRIAAEFQSNGITFVLSGNSGGRDCTAYSMNKVDVTGRTKLHASVKNVRTVDTGYSSSDITIALTTQNEAEDPTETFVASYAVPNGTDSKDVDLDISDISGKYYIAVYADVATGVVNDICLI